MSKLKWGLLFFFVIGFQQAYCQKFERDIRKLNSDINLAKKAGKLTDLEYSKLKKEQDQIKLALDKAKADDIFTPDEKNKIHSKIVRSKKRLAKYKVNREIY